MSNNSLASVLEHMLKSEEVFWIYLSNNSNIYQAYKACARLLRVAGEAIDEQNQRVAKAAGLQQKVKKHQNARMHIEGALTYVEEQLNTLQAASPPPPMPFPPASAPVAPMATHPI